MINLIGPDRFPSVTLLRDALRNVPEEGTFTMGGWKVIATEQLRRFQEAGLRVPEWTKDRTVAENWALKGSVVLGRKEDHTQGKDIIIQNKQTLNPRWLRRDWWCKFTPSTAEWRIHVFDGRCIARGKKVYQAHAVGYLPVPIRSRRNGWLLQHDLEPSEALRTAGRGAVAALEYLYGAVDILETPNGPVVLEVNRLPAMDDYTRAAYVRAIRRHVAGRRVPKLQKEFYEGVEVW